MSEKVKVKIARNVIHLPAIALRGLVVFPNNVVHFEVGRPKSIAAIETAMRGNGSVFLVAQREMDVEEPALRDLYSYGVIAEIKQVLESYEPINMCLRPAPMVLHLDGLRIKIPYAEHREYLENVMIYGRRLGEIADITPSKIDDSSVLIRIKSRSQIEDEDRRKALR